MANPEVDRLIQELSQILNTNREKRSTSEAMVQGMQRGQKRAQQQSLDAARQGQAAGAGANAAAMNAGPGKERRLSAAEQYAKGVKLKGNAAPYDFLSESEQAAPPTSPADQATLEERKKRMTQTMMLSRGERGGPLGGAGQEPIDPAVSEALTRAGNPQFPPSPEYPTLPGARPDPMTAPNPYQQDQWAPGHNPPPPPPPPQGWSPDDYAKLNALSQRYPG
jgi:hypothetical protein